MSDHKKTIETEQTDEDTASNVALFANEADSSDVQLRQLDVDRRASNASFSLGRLEQDLRSLQSKWHAVEQEMSERDRQISELQLALDAHHEKSAALAADLERMNDENRALSDDLSLAHADVDVHKCKEAELDRMVEAHQEELNAARRDQEALSEEKRQLQHTLTEERDSTVSTTERLTQLNSENVELRIHIQELQDYIDGRKSDWGDLNAQLREYEDTIKGISSSLEAHDEVIAQKDEEKAGLALKVMELERQLAELQGRHSERESSHAELQQTLDNQSRELGSLNSESLRMNKNIEKLRKKLERRDATLSSLRQDIKDRSRDSSSLEGLLAAEKATVAEVQAKLQASDDRILALEAEQKERDQSADELGVTIGELRERLRLSEPTTKKHEKRIEMLEESLRASAANEKELRSGLAAAASKLENVSGKAAEYEIRAAELNAVLLEARSDQKSVEVELEAQRELVQVLEKELHDKQESLDVLDRSADRLSAIGSGIRELDVRIDDHWCEQPQSLFEQSDELFEPPEEDLLKPEELLMDPESLYEHVIVAESRGMGEAMRFPLNREEITIGRSSKCDIRLNSKFISRNHARIRLKGDCAIIEDIGSTNGFLVNSKHMTRHTLTHGDKLQIGKSKFQYLHTSLS